MNFAHAISVVQDALIYANRYVHEHGTVEDIKGIVDEYLSAYGLDDDVNEVVETAANLLNAAAGHGSGNA